MANPNPFPAVSGVRGHQPCITVQPAGSRVTPSLLASEVMVSDKHIAGRRSRFTWMGVIKGRQWSRRDGPKRDSAEEQINRQITRRDASIEVDLLNLKYHHIAGPSLRPLPKIDLSRMPVSRQQLIIRVRCLRMIFVPPQRIPLSHFRVSANTAIRSDPMNSNTSRAY